MNPITALDDQNIEGKTALLRVDYNVPIQDGKIVDDLRIRASLRTIEYLRKKGAKIVVISHIEGKGSVSLSPVSAYPFAFPVMFEKDLPGAAGVDGPESLTDRLARFKKDRLESAPNGSVFLFENLRQNPGETANDPQFSAALASIADIFVGDAFSVSHRKHASIVGVPALLPHYAGFQILEEISELQKGLNPNHPFIFILGGAKFDTKLPLIQKFMRKADKVLIAGALLNDIMMGRGMPVGKSLVSNATLPDEIINDPEGKIIDPTDVIVKNTVTGEISKKKVDIEHARPGVPLSQEQDEILPEDSVLDAGPSVIAELSALISSAQDAGQKPFVLWNGPLGDYEDGFVDQTVALARLIIDSGVDALIGGGDTTAAIAKVSATGTANAYVSTGGGAMIDYLINETLPGIEALK